MFIARVYCLIGDGESAEGSIWESIAFASHYKLDNLVLIIDANRLGQSEPTMIGHDLDIYKRRLDAFDFNTVIVDGHDVKTLVNIFDTAASSKGKPFAVIAKTYKVRQLREFSIFFLTIYTPCHLCCHYYVTAI